MKRVVVIGGGIAGLSAAYSLREHQRPGVDFEIIILEKNPSLGGNIKTEKVNGFLIEGGPDCFLSEKPWAMELCKRLGLGGKLIPTNEENRKTFVLSGGKLHELPEGVILMIPTKIMPFALSSLITLRGKLRMALEVFIPRKKEKEDETLGDFVRRRLGKEALEKIAEPLVAGVHAGDPETMSIRSSFPRFVQLEEEHGSLILGMLKTKAAVKRSKAAKTGSADGPKFTMFMTLKGGLSEMIDTLASSLIKFKNTSIMANETVTGILRKAKGYEVRLADNNVVGTDAVIVASPAYAASNLLSGLDPELSQKLLTIPYVSTATVSMAFKRSDVRHPLNGFGFVVPRAEKRRIMAATWTSVKFKYRSPDDSILIRCFVGGAKNSGSVELADEEMARTVSEELKDIMGIEARPVLTRVYRWKLSMPQYTIGHEARVNWIEERISRYPGLFVTGSAYHGIGISDSVRTSEVVAKKALHYLFGSNYSERPSFNNNRVKK